MNSRQREVEYNKLKDEQKVLAELKKHYETAAKDIAKNIRLQSGKINVLMKDWDNLDEKEKSILQSQIYQRGYQESLKQQIDGFIDAMNSKQHTTIAEYLEECYKTAFVGSVYDLHGQKIPMILPINQNQMIKAATLNSKVSKKLYGTYLTTLKKHIKSEISRGVATGLSYADIARNLDNRATKITYNQAARIARTEGHGVQCQAAWDAQHAAKDAGADVVKQWDAALDKRTRQSHRELDGQLRELDEKFSNGMMMPSDPAGGAAEVVNCRCALLQRAKWALDEEELETLKERAAYHGLDKTKSFDEFKGKYLKAAAEETKEITETDKKAILDYMSAKSYVLNDKLRRKQTLTPDEDRFTMELDTALDKMPKHEGNLQRSVYFMSDDAVLDFMDAYKIDEVVTYKEYLSTTKGVVYNPDAQIQIYIQDAKSGCDISEYNGAEDEVLYKRNSSFRIMNIVEQEGKHFILMVEDDE